MGESGRRAIDVDSDDHIGSEPTRQRRKRTCDRAVVTRPRYPDGNAQRCWQRRIRRRCGCDRVRPRSHGFAPPACRRTEGKTRAPRCRNATWLELLVIATASGDRRHNPDQPAPKTHGEVNALVTQCE
jgi:hypothetical protein